MRRPSKVRWAGVAVAGWALALAACGGDKERGSGEEPKAAGKAAARDPAVAFIDGITAFNEANVKGVREAYAPNAAWWNPTRAAAPARGVTQIIKALSAFKAFIPDSRIGVRRVLRRGSSLVAQASVTGTKRWTEHGTEEDPKRIGFEMIYFVLADEQGRARETLVYFDVAVSHRQAGTLKGEVRPVPVQPDGKPEIVGAPGAKGGLEKAEAALEALAKGGQGLEALAAEGFVYTDTSSGKRVPLAELPAFLAALTPAVNGLAYKTQQSLAAGPYVAIRWEARGSSVQAGEGAEPAEVVLHGAHVFTLTDGRISAVEAYTSEMEYLEKTGLIAQSAGEGEDALGPRGAVKEEAAPPTEKKP
ncbi:MAG: nuclear transport factor 2 family protein [Proteobacteria bacterium]|jgi:hypothetical protein|nr:nuclear transport factor 2 family protein [Pseudomonadota bacterium]